MSVDSRAPSEVDLMRWSEALAAIARTGLAFSDVVYERERFEEVLNVAADIRERAGSAFDSETLVGGWLESVGSGVPGYVTPKVTVGAVVGNDDGEILLVQRAESGLWLYPTGWADVGYSPAEVVVKEVREETGLIVESWTSTVYEVSVDFPDRGMRLGVEVFVAESWHGSMVFEDPDGIVEEGRFVDLGESAALLVSAPAWVREPVGVWLGGAIEPGARFEYMAKGTRPGNMTVERR